MTASVPTHLSASDKDSNDSDSPSDTTTKSAENAVGDEIGDSSKALTLKNDAPQDETASTPKAGDNTLSFMDGKESLLKAPAFVGEGVPSTSLTGESANHDLADRDAANETAKASPLSSLLRRRRFLSDV